MVKNLKLEEKASLLTNGAAGVPRIDWPAYNWWSESLHGVARAGVASPPFYTFCPRIVLWDNNTFSSLRRNHPCVW